MQIETKCKQPQYKHPRSRNKQTIHTIHERSTRSDIITWRLNEYFRSIKRTERGRVAIANRNRIDQNPNRTTKTTTVSKIEAKLRRHIYVITENKGTLRGTKMFKNTERQNHMNIDLIVFVCADKIELGGNCNFRILNNHDFQMLSWWHHSLSLFSCQEEKEFLLRNCPRSFAFLKRVWRSCFSESRRESYNWQTWHEPHDKGFESNSARIQRPE